MHLQQKGKRASSIVDVALALVAVALALVALALVAVALVAVAVAAVRGGCRAKTSPL